MLALSMAGCLLLEGFFNMKVRPTNMNVCMSCIEWQRSSSGQLPSCFSGQHNYLGKLVSCLHFCVLAHIKLHVSCLCIYWAVHLCTSEGHHCCAKLYMCGLLMTEVTPNRSMTAYLNPCGPNLMHLFPAFGSLLLLNPRLTAEARRRLRNHFRCCQIPKVGYGSFKVV